jgi:hypothetical protein
MSVLDWLLDSDPAIRWQVLRNLVHARATGGSAESIEARRRGEEYLLERKLVRRTTRAAGPPVVRAVMLTLRGQATTQPLIESPIPVRSSTALLHQHMCVLGFD